MDVGIVISILLQIGLGVIIVTTINRRRKKTKNENSSPFKKMGRLMGLLWGWLMIVLSIYNLTVYLFANLS
ncbi:MAG: hypothetical protein ACT6FF_08775 [Methanosarcinaceae archaeon]